MSSSNDEDQEYYWEDESMRKWEENEGMHDDE